LPLFLKFQTARTNIDTRSLSSSERSTFNFLLFSAKVNVFLIRFVYFLFRTKQNLLLGSKNRQFI